MSRSFAQTTELTCASCAQPFEAHVWLIIDADEQPELVARIADESIHTVLCPHCGTAHPLDAPLLFHRASDSTLIFAAQEQSTTEQDQNVARQLGMQLIASIPVAERESYLSTAQTVVGIDGLRRVLAGETEPETDELSVALRALMEATSTEEVQHAAQTYPVLTSPEALAQLREYVERLQSTGHADLASALTQRIEALQPGTTSHQPHPTLQLIQALLDAESVEQRAAVLQSRPQDVTLEVPKILEALADQAQRRHLDAVARDLFVIRDEVLSLLGRDTPITPSA